MQRVNIKKTDLEVSALCMGGCPLGGYGWGDVERRDLLDAVRTAVDSGIKMTATVKIELNTLPNI